MLTNLDKKHIPFCQNPKKYQSLDQKLHCPWPKPQKLNQFGSKMTLPLAGIRKIQTFCITNYTPFGRNPKNSISFDQKNTLTLAEIRKSRPVWIKNYTPFGRNRKKCQPVWFENYTLFVRNPKSSTSSDQKLHSLWPKSENSVQFGPKNF